MDAMTCHGYEACFCIVVLFRVARPRWPPLTGTDYWTTLGFSGQIEPWSLGRGSIGDPIFICADASGGPNGKGPRFWRVGFATARVV
eukprot:7410430-Pyramimonas_sp.AAC.1